MNFELLDNGIDSLNSGLVFYGKFLDYDDSYDFEQETYLKLATICIQSTIEILSMKIISKVDEMLIYKKRFWSELEILKNEVESDLMIYDVLVNYDNDIQTETYSRYVELLKELFKITDIEKNNLFKLGKIRNQLTHMGLVRDINYHHILLTINSALDFIVEFFYPRLKDERFEEMDYVYEEAQNLFEVGELFAYSIWSAYWGFNFYEINESVKQAVIELNQDEDIINKCMEVRLLIEKDVEANEYQIEVIDSSTGELINDVTTINLPRLDATAIVGESVDGPIYAVIDHNKNDKHLYIFKERLNLDGYEDCNEKFWQNTDLNCYQRNISVEAFKDVINLIMRYKY